MSAFRLAFALGAVLAGGCARRPQPTEAPARSASPRRPKAPIPAPAWALKDVDGHVVRSDQFRGKVLVVDFWATWCRPCLTEMPALRALENARGPDGLAVVGISVDGNPAAVRKYLQHHPTHFPILMADDKVVDAFGGMDGVPTTFIIDRDGMIRGRMYGLQKAAELERRVAACLDAGAAEK